MNYNEINAKAIQDNFENYHESMADFSYSYDGIKLLSSFIPGPQFNTVINHHSNALTLKKLMRCIQNKPSMRFDQGVIGWWEVESNDNEMIPNIVNPDCYHLIDKYQGLINTLEQLKPTRCKDKCISVYRVDSPDEMDFWIHPYQLCQKKSSSMLRHFYKKMMFLSENCPNLINYIVFKDALPVASSSMYIQNQIAGLYHYSQIDGKRSDNILDHLVQHQLQDAHDLSCNNVILQAPSNAYQNYVNLNFKPVSTYAHYEVKLNGLGI